MNNAGQKFAVGRICRPDGAWRIHHVHEHVAGGATTLENGILICSDCHSDRVKMQSLSTNFQDYLKQFSRPK
jgi:5-methylcytosine-specific restriction endonuclease McrA